MACPPLTLPQRCMSRLMALTHPACGPLPQPVRANRTESAPRAGVRVGLGFFPALRPEAQWVTGLRPHVGVVTEGTVTCRSPPVWRRDWTQEEDGLRPLLVLWGAELVLGDVIPSFGEDKYITVDSEKHCNFD